MSNPTVKPADLTVLETAAASGNKDALINLGILYELGLGVPQDYKKAMEYWKKASDAGSGLADLSMSKIIGLGLGGITVNKEVAEKLREKASANGFVDPTLKLLMAKDESGKIRVQEATKGKKILIADASKSLRTDMQLILKHFGFETAFTESGTEAYKLIETDRRIELLILDVNLTGLTGLALIEKLKSHKELYRVPIIVITNDGSKESVLKGKSCGVAAWLLKPPNADMIQKLVQKLLGAQKKAA